MFDAYENVRIQERAMKQTHGLEKKELKQTWKIKYFDIQHENNMEKKKQRSKSQ